MAAPATHTKFVKFSGGKYRRYPVTASADIRRGDLLKIASGKVDQLLTKAAVSSATVSGGNATIWGIAEEDFTADANGVSSDGQSRTTIGVRVVDDSFEIELRGYNATATDCQQQDFAIGTAYLIQRWTDANGNWWYEVNTTTTNAELMKTAQSLNSNATDNYGISKIGRAHV